MKQVAFLLIAIIALLGAAFLYFDPRGRVLPTNTFINLSRVEQVLLSDEEISLLAAYSTRMLTTPASKSIPMGTTVREAVSAQRDYNHRLSTK